MSRSLAYCIRTLEADNQVLKRKLKAFRKFFDESAMRQRRVMEECRFRSERERKARKKLWPSELPIPTPVQQKPQQQYQQPPPQQPQVSTTATVATAAVVPPSPTPQPWWEKVMPQPPPGGRAETLELHEAQRVTLGLSVVAKKLKGENVVLRRKIKSYQQLFRDKPRFLEKLKEANARNIQMSNYKD